MADPWKRKRKDRIGNQTPSKLNVDVHGILLPRLVGPR